MNCVAINQTLKNQNTMIKKLLAIIAFVMTMTLATSSNAQTVFQVDSKYDADVKVYVASSKYDADLVVYKVSSKYDVNKDGLWYFVSSKYDATYKVYFVDSKYDADIIIYYANSKYDAQWRNTDKKSKMNK